MVTGEEPANDQSYKYLTTEEMLKIPDDSMQMDPNESQTQANTLKKDSTGNRSVLDGNIEQKLIRYLTMTSHLFLSSNFFQFGVSKA